MKVAIVGAGIAGLTCAAAVRRFVPGVAVEIYERDAELRRQGYSLGIKGESGIRVLRELDLFDGLRPDALLTTCFVFCDQRGRVLMRLPSRGEGKNATYRIKRSRLVEALHAASSGVPIRFGAECVGYDDGKLRLADGTTVTADWLVAADGVSSAVRPALLSGGRHDLGLSAITGDAPVSIDHPLLRGGNFLMLGDDGSSVFCYTQEGGVHLSYAVHTDPDALAQHDPLATLRAATADWAAPVPEIAATIDASSIVVRGYYDREPPARVHTQALWLIGDAAHPMAPFLGQGANTGMLDALGLARLIGGEGSADRLERDIVTRARKAVLDSRKTAAMMHTTDRRRQVRRNRSWRFADVFINLPQLIRSAPGA